MKLTDYSVPNGAGKTTTINIICSLIQPDSGTVTINHQPISQATKSLIGVAPQENLLYKQLTCRENLNFYAQIYGLSALERHYQIEACLRAVNLFARANSLVETLSGGMQRRLNIAVALIHKPKLLILDEPTTGLDIEARYDIWRLIETLRSQGITILLTTHLLDEAQHLCQRIGILKAGQIIAQGSLKQLCSQIPAQAIVVIKTEAEESALARAQKLGLTHRRYGNDLGFWLPKQLELKQILAYFEGIPLNSIACRSVELEHVYLELTQHGLRRE